MPLFFYFHTYSREIIDMFPDLTKKINVDVFADTVQARFCQPFKIITLTIHTRFDDLDLVSRSHMCQNHRLLILFRFLSTVV